MQFITRTIRNIYPVWTESNKAQFIDTDIVPVITMREAQSEDDLPIRTAALATDVLIPVETLQPLEPHASFLSMDSLMLQVWVNGETHCFAVQCSIVQYNSMDGDMDNEVISQHRYQIRLDSESQTVLGETPLHEVINVYITPRMTLDLNNATLCVTAEPATINVEEDEESSNTYAAKLIGFSIIQVLRTDSPE